MEELEFLSIHVLENYQHHFDLSGIVDIEGEHWVINDKAWSHNAYKIDLDSDKFYLVDSLSLGIDYQSDIEGLDYCPELGILFIDEEYNLAYQTTGDGQNKVIFNKEQLPNDKSWGNNKGLEGIAVDCEKKILYLAKERGPRFIIIYDLNHQQVTDIVNLEDPMGDVSDLKVENGYLYILERNENLIAKMDLGSKQIVSKVSYKNTCSHPAGKLYKNSQYGMAEAFLLTPDEIWVGLDNNGMPFSDHAQQTYGLSGDQPVLIKFKRPVGF